ncbi:MAG: hypothetical protein ACI9G5_000100 [Paracoccaceae bacterium]|jgi:hypothetical protein
METLKGTCLCGEVEYQITNNPLMIVACHCLSCQKSSGGGYTSTMALPEASFTLINGNPDCWDKTDENGIHHRRYFCGTCACRLHYTSADMPRVVKLKTGTLENSNHIIPDAHFYVSRKPAWFSLPASAVQFETVPKSQEELFSAIEASK